MQSHSNWLQLKWISMMHFGGASKKKVFSCWMLEKFTTMSSNAMRICSCVTLSAIWLLSVSFIWWNLHWTCWCERERTLCHPAEIGSDSVHTSTVGVPFISPMEYCKLCDQKTISILCIWIFERIHWSRSKHTLNTLSMKHTANGSDYNKTVRIDCDMF